MSPHEDLFHRLLDESSSLLAAPAGAGISIPDDELHRDIIVPLLPAMLADAAIRGHWSEQHATGFPARIGRHFENGDPAPRWTPGDFEIHVTASYSAGADARALADTLLSEDSLRDMTAALMNQLLDALWPSLAPAPAAEAVPEEISTVVEIAAAETVAAEIATDELPPAVAQEISEEKIAATTTVEIPAGETASPDADKIFADETATPEAEELPAAAFEPDILPSAIPPSATGAERVEEALPAEIQTAHPPSRALIRALCRELAASAVQRGLVANSAMRDASAAIVARRIFQRASPPRKRKRTESGTVCLG